MCNTSLQQNGFNNTVDPLSFSTFHLLRTCNRLMLPNTGENWNFDFPAKFSKKNK